MKITIEKTDLLTSLDGVPVRVWTGVTERGTECVVYVHRIRVASEADVAQFEAELTPQPPPAPAPISLRHIL